MPSSSRARPGYYDECIWRFWDGDLLTSVKEAEGRQRRAHDVCGVQAIAPNAGYLIHTVIELPRVRAGRQAANGAPCTHAGDYRRRAQGFRLAVRRRVRHGDLLKDAVQSIHTPIAQIRRDNVCIHVLRSWEAARRGCALRRGRPADFSAHGWQWVREYDAGAHRESLST